MRLETIKHKVIGFGFGVGLTHEGKNMITMLLPFVTFQLIKK